MSTLVFSSKKNVIEHLQGRIHHVETQKRNDDGSVISSGSADIDRLLPANGYNRGTIIEWQSTGGSCADFFSLMAARNATRDGGAMVIIDHANQFYPPAARALGIQLGNLIVLRGQEKLHQEDFFWSIDQSLRCNAVAAVWGALPNFKDPSTETRWLRRFQLSAETSGCCGMFIRSSRKTTPSSWSEIQWSLRPLRNISHTGDTRLVRATLVRCRGSHAGSSIDLEVNNVTGNVRQARREHAQRPNTRPSYTLPLAAQLANPKTRRRAARA
ncbi:MAG: hypothetical protein AAGA30_12350 [Planctomycetota bacterium]